MSQIIYEHDFICKDIKGIIDSFLMPSKLSVKKKFDNVLSELIENFIECSECDMFLNDIHENDLNMSAICCGDYYLCESCLFASDDVPYPWNTLRARNSISLDYLRQHVYYVKQ